MWIIGMIIIGLIAGALARLVVPGPDSIGLVGTLLLGLVGSAIGGFLGWLLFGRDATDGALQTSGLVGSFIGAVLALVAYRAMNGHGRGSSMHHGGI